MDSHLKLVISSISTNNLARGHQRWAQDVLEIKKVPHQLIDICQEENAIYRRVVNEGGFKLPLMIIGDRYVTFEELEELIEDRHLEDVVYEKSKPGGAATFLKAV